VLCEGNLEGGYFTGDPEGYVEGSGDGHLFPYGPLWGTWKRAHLRGTLMDEMGLSLCRGPVGEPGEAGPFTRNLED
jgi:hypothetical protein